MSALRRGNKSSVNLMVDSSFVKGAFREAPTGTGAAGDCAVAMNPKLQKNSLLFSVNWYNSLVK